jgi:hypothetical protein
MARLQKTLVDYVIIAITPALIMVMVGSLVFFLIEAFYGGGFAGRAQYIFGLFIFAAVLIARISIEDGRERAVLFAIPLAGAMLVVLGFSLGNILLIGLIWWCADKLTWDCTVIDERQDVSGEGLLQTVGLDGHSEEPASGAATPPQDLEATSSCETPPPPANWWERFVQRRKRPHAPGVWVIYFSLAALPLFGIGQRFIPDGDVEARREAFKLLCYYVGSGLGLLMTTSFLGLRRYLRQRRLEMPLDMTGVWLTVGTVMILSLMLFCAVLPRPSAEYSVTDLSFQIEALENRQASPYGWGDEGAEDEEKKARSAAPSERETSQPAGGQSGKQKVAGGGSQEGQSQGGEAEAEQGSGGETERQGDGSDSSQDAGQSSQASEGGGRKQPSGGQESGGGPSDQSGGESPGTQGKPSGGSSGEQDQSSSGSPGDGGDQAEPPTETGEGASESRTEDEAADRSRAEQRRDDSPESQQERRAGTSGSPASRPRPPSSFNPGQMVNSLLGSLPQVLKGLYYLFFILLVGYLLWRYREEVINALRNFLQAIRDFWSNLFGSRQEEDEAEAAPAEPAPPPRPFAEFADPFAAGTADRYSPQELVAYSFQALEAWGREHGCVREPEQTPHEYAGRLSSRQAAVGREARTLAELYCFAAYSPAGDSLSRENLERLRQLWQVMQTHAI